MDAIKHNDRATVCGRVVAFAMLFMDFRPGFSVNYFLPDFGSGMLAFDAQEPGFEDYWSWWFRVLLRGGLRRAARTVTAANRAILLLIVMIICRQRFAFD